MPKSRRALDEFPQWSGSNKLCWKFGNRAEVYGSLETEARFPGNHALCAEQSIRAASKAASDHLVRSYHRTYGLPVKDRPGHGSALRN